MIYLHVKEYRKYIPIMPPDLAQGLTLISSNYPCLELIIMVPKVFEPLEFDCINVNSAFLAITTNKKLSFHAKTFSS